MSISLTPENKIDLALTGENKDLSLTWDEATFTWDDSLPMTWDTQGLHIGAEAKNTLSLSNESKN